MKFYVVSDSVIALKATPAALSKALFANSKYLGFKNLDDAKRLANDGVHPFDHKAFAVYEIQVKDKTGIKAGECVLSNDDVIENVVEINRLKAKDFTVVCAYLRGTKLPVAPLQVEAPKAAAKAKVAPKAKAKVSPKAHITRSKADAIDVENDAVVVEPAPAPAAPAGRFARLKAYFSNLNPQLTRAVVGASALGLVSLAVRAAIVSGLVVVTTPVVVAAALATTAIAAAAYFGPSAYARYKLTRQERHAADLKASNDALATAEEKLLVEDKTPTTKQFIRDLHNIEEMAPFAKFKADGSDVQNQPAITKVHVVQFEEYAVKKALAAKPEDRANVEKELLAEANKKFNAKA